MIRLIENSAWLAAGAIAVDYGYNKYLHSRALNCLIENQLAIVNSGEHPVHLDQHTISIVKASTIEMEVVGTVHLTYTRNLGIFQSNKWAVDINDRGLEDLSPVGNYLSYSQRSLLPTIIGDKKKAMKRILTASDNLPVRMTSDRNHKKLGKEYSNGEITVIVKQ